MNDTTSEIAYSVAALLKSRKFLEAQSRLFSDDIISLEPVESGRQSLIGLKDLQAKEIKFFKLYKRMELF